MTYDDWKADVANLEGSAPQDEPETEPEYVGARPIRKPVEGAPFQPGQAVRVVDAIDTDAHDVTAFVGRIGTVSYLEYECGCGQSFPEDPMIGVLFDDTTREEFWAEELIAT